MSQQFGQRRMDRLAALEKVVHVLYGMPDHDHDVDIPDANADDLAHGALSIPHRVVTLRAAGYKIPFVDNGRDGHYWVLPNGERDYF